MLAMSDGTGRNEDRTQVKLSFRPRCAGFTSDPRDGVGLAEAERDNRDRGSMATWQPLPTVHIPDIDPCACFSVHEHRLRGFTPYSADARTCNDASYI